MERTLLANDSGYWYIPVTWPLAKLARSLKAIPTGNGINPQLGWSNSLLSLFRTSTTTSAILTETTKGVRPQGLTETSLHVLPNWFNDCNYLLGCMFCRGRLMASKTYADRRKLGEGALSKRFTLQEKRAIKCRKRHILLGSRRRIIGVLRCVYAFVRIILLLWRCCIWSLVIFPEKNTPI